MPRRSVYADKLAEFPDFAFGDDAIFGHRGRWADFFRDRIGPAFNGRVIFEIGCFDVSLLNRLAGRFPDTAFIGLDWKCKSLYEGAARVAENGHRNIALLRGRAQDISRIFSSREVDEIWIFHPDPCDEPDQLQNRLIAEPFLIDAQAVLRDADSRLFLKTDHPGYYQWTLSLLGLPQPTWFETKNPDPSAPRTKRHELMSASELPPPSRAIASAFEVPANTTDYWRDRETVTRSTARLFAGEITTFESRFIRKRWPIYYVELRRR